MSSSTSATRSGLADLVGTRDLLHLVAQKLASQILLFSIAAIVFILAAFFLFAGEGLVVALFITFIFLIGAAGYLFIEERRKVHEGRPEAVSTVLANRLDAIHHHDSAGSSLRVSVQAQKRSVSGSGARDISVEPVNDHATFRIGDEVEISVQATEDCFLTLLNIGTSGRLTILFPNALHPDSRLEANRPHVIPGQEYGFRYVLKGPIGTERLKAIVTTEPVKLVEASFTADGGLFHQVEPTAAARDIAIVKETTDALPDAAWAEANFSFDVRD